MRGVLHDAEPMLARDPDHVEAQWALGRLPIGSFQQAGNLLEVTAPLPESFGEWRDEA